jgi:hypothetical protein
MQRDVPVGAECVVGVGRENELVRKKLVHESLGLELGKLMQESLEVERTKLART